MSFRYMRIFVMFDLPVATIVQRRAYRRFRKGLIRQGFIMFQESIYVKLVLNSTAQTRVMECVRRMKPSEGLVNMMCLTEKQFQRIECLIGDNKSDLLDSTERLVVL